MKGGKSCEQDQAGLLKPKRLKGSSYPPGATFRSPKSFERHEGRVFLLLCLLIYRQQQCRVSFHEGQQSPEFPSGPHQPRHTATHLCALWEVSWPPQQGFPADLCINSFHQEGILNMRYYFRELSDIRISLPFHLSQFNSPFPTSYTFPMFKLCYPSTESWFKMLDKKKNMRTCTDKMYSYP